MKPLVRPKLFEYRDYKVLLREWLRFAAEQGAGAKAKLARALQAPSPFLSQVLHGSVHFTPDHAIRCAQYWNLNPDERDYFLDLVQHARAGSKELRSYLDSKLKLAQEKHKELSHRLDEPTLHEGEAKWMFYTNWRLSPVCLLLTIPEYRTVRKIADRLRVSEDEIRSDLKTLAAMGLIEAKGSSFVVTGKSIHLDRTSPMSPINHLLWRQKSIVEIMNPKQQNYHYSGLHTLSRADMERVQTALVDALENCRKIIAPSKEEDLICISVDLFSV